jgi:hypothetical protein
MSTLTYFPSHKSVGDPVGDAVGFDRSSMETVATAGLAVRSILVTVIIKGYIVPPQLTYLYDSP